MSILSSQFDIVSVDANPLAHAALAVILQVEGNVGAPGATTGLNTTLDSLGTPVAGSLPPGTVVVMNAYGRAVAATSPDLSAAPKVLPFITIDGNTDYSGSFVQKLTCLQGGFIMKTDQVTGTSFTPGGNLTFASGKVKVVADAAKDQVIGVVGPNGYDATNGVLEVIVPQGGL